MAKPKLGSGARFKNLTHQLGNNDNIKDPAALAAWIGAKKYGHNKMHMLAAKGKKG